MPLILHVEDEGSVRLLYKEVFEELGYRVVQAPNAEDALKMLRNCKPDVIILDLKMPGIGGRGFLERLQRLKLKIPVVISTAYPYFEGDPTVAASADAFVVKSGDMEKLILAVSDLTGKTGRG
jgi:CheY-like chemotaxis protein